MRELCIALLIGFCFNGFGQQTGTFIDPRDSQQTGTYPAPLDAVNGDTIIAGEQGLYPVDAMNDNPIANYEARSSDEQKSVENEEIALVTTLVIDDNTQYNLVVWERKADAGIDHYNIYKKGKDQGEFIKIGELPFFQISVFIDSNSMAGSESETYRIAAVDAFGNESELSPPHKTMNLTLTQNINNKIHLTWEHYIGIDYLSYKVYRGTSPDNLELLEEIEKGSENIQTYADDPPPGTYYYQVRIDLPRIIDPAQFKSTATYSQVHSNMEKKLKSGTHIRSSSRGKGMNFYPNPVKNTLHLNLHEAFEVIEIVDSKGQPVWQTEIISGDMVLDISDLTPGFYLIKLQGNGEHATGKFIKE